MQFERLRLEQRSVPVRSVPPRGSGWVMTLPIAYCQMPIACLVKSQLAIGNRQLAITRPTRYRVVVLTSPGPHLSQSGWANCISTQIRYSFQLFDGDARMLLHLFRT